jgi:NitT/TauT family transport system substrate-binding protein
LLFDSRQIPGEVLDILAMRESAVTKQPDTAKALTIGWFRALDYLHKYPKTRLVELLHTKELRQNSSSNL